MRTKVLLTIVVAVMLIVSVATIGSNMGFKISIPLSTNGDGSNFVALPYYWTPPTWGSDPSPGSTTASDLIYDVNGALAGTEVDTYDPVAGTYAIRRKTGLGWSGTDFAITPGVAYVVKVPANVNYICVGSHNPTLQIALSIAGDGSNFVSVPYHFTGTTASNLITDVNGAVAGTEVDSYDPVAGTYVIRRKTGLGWSGTDFSLTPGVGYVIKVPVAVNWTPSHY